MTVAAATLLALATPAEAQIVSVNGAWIHNAAVSAPVAEVFVAGPPLVGLRPYAIASLDLDSGDPTFLTRVGKDRQLGGWRVAAGVGAVWLKFLDYSPRPSLGMSGFAPAVKGFQVYGVAAYERAPAWGWTTFVGVTRTVYFRR